MLHKDCFGFECEIRGKCKCRVTKKTNCEKCRFYKTVDKYNADAEKYGYKKKAASDGNR